MLTKKSNPAEAAIDDLYAGGRLRSGKIEVGPIRPNAQRLLSVLWNERAALAAKAGVEQGRLARHGYLDVAESPSSLTEARSNSVSGDVPSPGHSEPKPQRSWRLHRLRAMSFRGIAPLGEVFEHQFAGAPTLIYGTNGSGKSSLLSAVGWVLTGNVTTDGGAAAGPIAVYARKKASADPTKVGTWPSVHTLPRNQDPTKVDQDCWVEVHLRTASEEHDLFLRRDLAGLKESVDGEIWQPCASLAAHGIGPLDLQLSLTAAAMFSHESLGGASGAQQLLAMILGFEELEEIGKLASTLSGNLTRTITDETKLAEVGRANIRDRLLSQLHGLRDDHPLRSSLNSLATSRSLSSESVATLAEHTAGLVESATAQLACVIGLNESGSAPSGLADALVSAIRLLEMPQVTRFREADFLRLDAFLHLRGTDAADIFIDGLAADLDQFLSNAERRIDKRFAMWLDELAPASRKTLLIQAAIHYDGNDSLCPVCQQSVEGLPVAQELLGLADIPDDLRRTPDAFFQNLREELLAIFPETLLSYGSREPIALFRRDWANFTAQCSPVLGPVIAQWARAVNQVIDGLPMTALHDFELLPDDADLQFRKSARSFLDYVGRARRSIATMRWTLSNLAATQATLEQLLTSEGGPTQSLLSCLGLGRVAAEDIRPIAAVRTELLAILRECDATAAIDRGIVVIEEMKDALDDLKPIGLYAVEEVRRVFGDIEASTLANFEKLYSSPNQSLKPTRLQISGKVKERSIEALLGGGSFEVPSQQVSNAGQLRALALAFYFALLEKHPAGLGFVIMDDPILSLDEDNRREWSNRLLQPALDTTQFVVSTHQLHYLNTCRADFHAGRILEINLRRHDTAMTIRDGGRLERAADLLLSTWRSAANEMRKYREDVLITLDSYSPSAFFTTRNLELSLTRYSELREDHPLAHKHREVIVRTLRGSDVSSVLDAGSHAHTEASVGVLEVRKCLSALKAMDETFRKEIKRLSDLRRHTRFDPEAPTAPPLVIDDRPLAPVIPIRFPLSADVEPEPTCLRFSVIGSAAAQSHGHVVDFSERPSPADFRSVHAIVVLTDALLPIARPGQWALLAPPGETLRDGDLVAAYDGAQGYFLRRASSSGSHWLLGALNPLAKEPIVMIHRERCAVRKVVGVVSDHSRTRSTRTTEPSREWRLDTAFSGGAIAGSDGVRVVGTSLEPIAKDGQFVLVGPRESNFDAFPSGELFVVETDLGHVGSVIKLAFRNKDSIALASPNTIDPHEPIFIAKQDVRAMRRVRGVLFDVRLTSEDFT